MHGPIMPPARLASPAAAHSVSDILRAIADTPGGPRITIRELVTAFGDRAFGLGMIVFALPNCVPIPGLGSLFGIPLLILACQMALGRREPWLPDAMLDRSIERTTLVRLVDLVEPRLRKVESVLKPRLTWLFSSAADRLIGLFVVLCAISIIIPLPGTNFPPAIAVILISLAIMELDGIVLLAGLLLGLAGLTYTTVLVGGLALAGWVALTSAIAF